MTPELEIPAPPDLSHARFPLRARDDGRDGAQAGEFIACSESISLPPVPRAVEKTGLLTPDGRRVHPFVECSLNEI